jgi:S1-C subfamily serine protease
MRAALFFLLLNFCATASAGESGEIGMRLKQEGLAWRVVGITPEGPADRAGLRAGNVVIQINNIFLPSTDQLRRTVAGLKPGDALKITVLGPTGPVDHVIKARSTSPAGSGAMR